MKHLLIVGRPGAGKTNLLRHLAHELRGCAIDGFLIDELRDGHELLGFWLSSLDGRQALLAHRRMDSSHRVGPFRVNVGLLDTLGVSIIRRAMREALILFIDGLGRLLLGAPKFQAALEEAFDRGPRIIASIGLHAAPSAEAFKRRHDVELVPLSMTNRRQVTEELDLRLKALCEEDDRVRQLQAQADHICEMIVASDVPEIDIEIQQARLRDTILKLFPDKQALYHLLYESRFRRLWQQFRQD